ncbi:EAL domain-containing protein [Sulfurimonas aquatica]|uniref:EAL domain-containing protein n=1 Tax=Sulfurimonas aquatica TaxID=2672570 RepID=A0A975AY61_9BACT|nr:EAL domain-containing protein [Sulfurimonas aquatica]QSZ40756.1 EAL domain-containing protein [Sulfurimonas aquatica]
MKHISIGRQPILDSDSNLCSYEILYQGSDAAMSRFSTASVINSVLNKFGTHALLGDRRAFVKIDEKFLMHDIIFSIPGEFFVFSILDSVDMNERVVERIEQLYEKGYILSIDNFTLTDNAREKYECVMSKLSFVKLNIMNSTASNITEMVQGLKSCGVTIVADNIDTLELYDKASELGCDWFQGYFFAEPKIIENAKYEPSQMAVLKLYNLLMQDTNIDEITKEFENNHEITVQLLQFINSGAFHFRHKISSVHHILTLVGRIPLAQWLMLMIYSKSVSNSGQSPIMLMVKNRTELMQNILKVVDPKAGSNLLGEAYFVGVISLIDTVFSVKLEDILEQLDISDEVEDAVLNDAGILGEIFALVRDIESFNVASRSRFEKAHGLEMGTIENVIFQSIEDVNKFETPFVA